MIKSHREIASNSNNDVLNVAKKVRGAKPLPPEDIDAKVNAMINNMRSVGSVVSYDITISIARGIICANDRTLLKENGGVIDLTTTWAHSTTTWAHSIHIRLGFTRRKFTTFKQPVSPALLKEVGFSYYLQIYQIICANLQYRSTHPFFSRLELYIGSKR